MWNDYCCSNLLLEWDFYAYTFTINKNNNKRAHASKHAADRGLQQAQRKAKTSKVAGWLLPQQEQQAKKATQWHACMR
jgi:hypothetical protein